MRKVVEYFLGSIRDVDGALKVGDGEPELRMVEGSKCKCDCACCAAICDWDGVKAGKLGPTARKERTHTQEKQCSPTQGGQVEYE